MESSAKPVQAKATADLIGDLWTMLNNPKLSDVHFVCQDGVKVYASRMLLAARSPVLMNLLKNTKSEFSLPNVSSATLLSIFEFLYTGMMIQHAPLSPKKVKDVIIAAEYFKLGAMEDLVRQFLINDPADIHDDITKAALTLSMKLELGTLSGTMGGASPLSLVRKLETSGQLEPPHLRALSRRAFRYFLDVTQQGMPNDLETVSLREYLRFRHIILWCVSQLCPDEEADVLKQCLPDETAAEHLLIIREKREALSRLPPPREAGDIKSLLVRRPESAAMVEDLLTLVDFRRIHAELLVAVVEPLAIASPEKLTAAFRFQALHQSDHGRSYRVVGDGIHQQVRLARSYQAQSRPGFYTAEGDVRLATTDQWQYGPGSYTVEGDGLVIGKASLELGFARFNVPIARPDGDRKDAYDGLYEWDIIIEELCDEFCEIGLHSVDSLQYELPNFSGSTLADQPTGWALSSCRNRKRLETRISQRGGDYGWQDFNKLKDFARVGARIRVHLDMVKHICSFSVDPDGPSAGKPSVAWVNLPNGVYFPAVSLGKGLIGKVRIELGRGLKQLKDR